MRQIRSVTIFGLQVVTSGGDDLLFTVDNDARFIVKTAQVVNRSGTDTTLTLLFTDSTGAEPRHYPFWRISLPDGEAATLYQHVIAVLMPGTKVFIETTGASVIDVNLHGVQLIEP